MRISLIHPAPLNGQTYTARILYPPLGIAYLASILRNRGFEVDLLDANALEYGLNDIISHLKNFNPDIVGLSVTTGTLDEIKLLASSIKEFNKNIIIIVGGSHATSQPETVINNDFVDYVLIGEGELVFPDLIEKISKNLKLNEIKGIAYKVDGRIIIQPPKDAIQDLDELPIPAYDLLPIEKYTSIQSSKKRIMIMITSRGCPFKCTFCAVPNVMGSKYRYLSPERVIKEIEYLKENFNIEEIHFK